MTDDLLTSTTSLVVGANGLMREHIGATVPMGLVGGAEEAAQAVLWLASPLSS